MGHGSQARFRRVNVVMMAASHALQYPSLPLESLNDRAAIHVCKYTHIQFETKKTRNRSFAVPGLWVQGLLRDFLGFQHSFGLLDEAGKACGVLHGDVG